MWVNEDKRPLQATNRESKPLKKNRKPHFVVFSNMTKSHLGIQTFLSQETPRRERARTRTLGNEVSTHFGGKSYWQPMLFVNVRREKSNVVFEPRLEN